MTIVEFAIPLNKEDLLHIGQPGQYVVEEVFSKNELPVKLRGTFYYYVSSHIYLFMSFVFFLLFCLFFFCRSLYGPVEAWGFFHS